MIKLLSISISHNTGIQTHDGKSCVFPFVYKDETSIRRRLNIHNIHKTTFQFPTIQVFKHMTANLASSRSSTKVKRISTVQQRMTKTTNCGVAQQKISIKTEVKDTVRPSCQGYHQQQHHNNNTMHQNHGC